MSMIKPALIASAAAALLLCSAVASAQQDKDKSLPAQAPDASGGEQRAQQKEPAQQDRKRAQTAPQDRPDKGTADTGRDKASKGTAEQGTSPKDQGTAQKGTDQKDKGAKGTAEQGTSPKDKGMAQKGTDPKDKGTKGTAEQGTSPKDKGTAQKETDPKDKGTKGTAEKGTEPKDRPDKGMAEKQPKEGTGARVQISEQQRTNVHQTILRERKLNRVTQVNFSINVGTRVPRTVHLAALPAAVVSIVPEYRNYRYFVVEEQIVIVEPSTYEIVEVITTPTTTAGAPAGRLVLTEEEKAIIVSEIEVSGDRTLGLGALVEGGEVPRGVEVRAFPDIVKQRVPKVTNHRYFTADNRIAIVDRQGGRVDLVIEARR
jgi:hypothetical protein